MAESHDVNEEQRPYVDDVLDVVEVTVLPVLLSVDGVHAEVIGSTAPAPSDRWHHLVDTFLLELPATGDGQTADHLDSAVRRFLVTAAAFLLAETTELDLQLTPGPSEGAAAERQARVQLVVADAQRAARVLLDRAEHARSDWLGLKARICDPRPIGGMRAIRRPGSERPAASIGSASAAEPGPAPIGDRTAFGRRGRQSLAEARYVSTLLGDAIDAEEERGSRRHRRVSALAKGIALTLVVIIDLPITLWLSMTVLDVDWSDPAPVAILAGLLIAVLGTAGAAVLPYQLGRDHRVFKTPDRALCWADLPVGSKVSLVSTSLLMVALSTGVLLGVLRAGALAGDDIVALLVSTIVVIALPVAAGVVFWLAFRDGSPERDYLASSSHRLQQALRRQRSAVDRTAAVERRLKLVRCTDSQQRRRIEIAELRQHADRVLEEPVIGPRGQLMTVAEAEHRRGHLTELIGAEEKAGSRRHRRTSGWQRLFMAAVVLVDVPILLVVPAAVLRSDPAPAPDLTIVISVVTAVVMTAAAGFALFQLGREQRVYKATSGRLNWHRLPFRAKVNCWGVGMLGALVAASVLAGGQVLFRTWVGAGPAWLAAAAFALAVPISAGLVVRTAFRDGSPEVDDLLCYTRLVEPYLQQRRDLLAGAKALRVEMTWGGCSASGWRSPNAQIPWGAIGRTTTSLWRPARRWVDRLFSPSAVSGVVIACLAAFLLASALQGGRHNVTVPFVLSLAAPMIAGWRAWELFRTKRRRAPVRCTEPDSYRLVHQLDLLADAGDRRFGGGERVARGPRRAGLGVPP